MQSERVIRARSFAVAVVIAAALASGIPALPGPSRSPSLPSRGQRPHRLATDRPPQPKRNLDHAREWDGQDAVDQHGKQPAAVMVAGWHKIVFVSSRDGTAEIYVMDADGANPTRLTNNGDYEGDPVFSPDGTKIAFEAFASTDYEIYVMNADGSGAANITNNAAEDRLPKWKPDGSRIAFQSNRDGAAVYLMSPTGTNLVSLTPPTAGDYGPAWSPDGSKLVFSRNTGTPATSGLYVTDHFDGTHQSLLTQDATMPAWSPEGDRIVFMTGRDFNPELYLMDADGSNHVRLTNDDAIGAPTYEDWFPDWQPAAVRVSPSTLSYGEAKVGTVGSTLDVTLKAGVAPITITSIVLAGSNPGEFAITQETCTGTPIAAGGTCTASVQFQPSVLGVRKASLVMAGPAPMSTRASPDREIHALCAGVASTPGPNNTWNDGAGLGAHRVDLRHEPAHDLRDRSDRRHVGDRRRSTRRRVLRPEHGRRGDVVHAEAAQPVRPARQPSRHRGLGRICVHGMGEHDEVGPFQAERATHPVLPAEHRPRRIDRLVVDNPADLDVGSRRLPGHRGLRCVRLRHIHEQRDRVDQARHQLEPRQNVEDRHGRVDDEGRRIGTAGHPVRRGGRLDRRRVLGRR